MKLEKKKALAARTLKVGKNRIIFDSGKLAELKEVITKQDIRDYLASGIIRIREIKGRKKVERRSRKRGPGKIKKKINLRKENYIIIVRKLRTYIKELKKQGKMNLEKYKELRRKIKNKEFKSKSQLKEYLGGK